MSYLGGTTSKLAAILPNLQHGQKLIDKAEFNREDEDGLAG